jgi:sulfatase maturation enzyme AslB (radical SAM superfamily)
VTVTLEEPRGVAVPEVDFLWLELTNRCNLRCVHCYAESGPEAAASDRLGKADYERLIDEGYELGCRRIQFIGGEPTLNHDLPDLIARARERGYEIVEVYTNLTHLPDTLLECFRRHEVSVATSFYSARPDVHYAITKVRGCFDRTVRNIRRVLEAKIPLRAGIIEMDENRGLVDEAVEFLRRLGVEHVGVDRVRKFGRAGEDDEWAMTELCGNCAGRTLCVGPDGAVSPCIMSKAWSVGSVLESSLAELSQSPRLGEVRGSIYRAGVAPRSATAATEGVQHGNPIVNCGPCEPQGGTNCNPWCHPGQQCIPCAPNGSNPCIPNGR